MPKCLHMECSVTSQRRIQSDGYCEKHSVEMANQQFDAKAEIEILKAENATLRNALKEATGEIINLNARLNHQNSNINASNYERDAIEQYGRLESWRMIDVDEKPIEYDADGNIIDDEDCAELAIKAAKLIGVTLDRKGIQRCHRIGRRRSPRMVKGKLSTPKPRQVILKLKDYDKRMEIMMKKRALQEKAAEEKCDELNKAFIVEDLTPLRSKLLWYCKNKCGGKI